MPTLRGLFLLTALLFLLAVSSSFASPPMMLRDCREIDQSLLYHLEHQEVSPGEIRSARKHIQDACLTAIRLKIERKQFRFQTYSNGEGNYLGVVFLLQDDKSNASSLRNGCRKSDSCVEVKEKETVDLLPFGVAVHYKLDPNAKHFVFDDKYSLTLSLANDSLNLSPVAIAYGLASGIKRMDGNDDYFTHGLGVAYRDMRREDGISISILTKSDLYIARVEEGKDDIYYTEDNTVEAVIDNKRQGKVFYWRAGVGWQWLNREGLGVFGAARQQEQFHHLVNADNNTQYRYLPGIIPSEKGAFVDISFGNIKDFKLSRSLMFRTNLTVGSRLNTIDTASFEYAQANGTLILKTRGSQFEGGAGTEFIRHPDGLQRNDALFLTFRRSQWGVRSSVEFPKGELQNYQDHNIDHEPIARLSLFYFKKKKKKE